MLYYPNNLVINLLDNLQDLNLACIPAKVHQDSADKTGELPSILVSHKLTFPDRKLSAELAVLEVRHGFVDINVLGMEHVKRVLSSWILIRKR